MHPETIVFLGGGNMARALIGGLMQQGWQAGLISVIELNPASREQLHADFGIACHANCAEADGALRAAALIVLAVKPQQMQAAIEPLGGLLVAQTLISIAAGLRLATLSQGLGGYNKLVRAMPNTPALVGAGMTGLYALAQVNAAERDLAERVLRAVGQTLWVEDEAMMDTITAVSGSGPAYAFLLMEAMQDAAIAQGCKPEDARLLATATVHGAALLAASSRQAISVLRTNVTSKGGTTEAALQTMHALGVPAAIISAIQAAQRRGRELGDQLALPATSRSATTKESL